MRSLRNSISSFYQEKPKEDSIVEFLLNSEIEFENTQLNNTGFGPGNQLHFQTKCKKPELKVPLYQENYLKEFKTEEEKAAARHALGIYNKGDVVAMSLLTAEDTLPTEQDWLNVTVKQLRKGDQFFTPVTSFDSVFDSNGQSLDFHLQNLNNLVVKQQKEIASLVAVSDSDTITSLGDVRVFLEGFNKGEILHDTLDNMNQEMLRFEKTGQIINNF